VEPIERESLTSVEAFAGPNPLPLEPAAPPEPGLATGQLDHLRPASDRQSGVVVLGLPHACEPRRATTGDDKSKNGVNESCLFDRPLRTLWFPDSSIFL